MSPTRQGHPPATFGDELGVGIVVNFNHRRVRGSAGVVLKRKMMISKGRHVDVDLTDYDN